MIARAGLALAAALWPAAAAPCGLALVLACDVSLSVDAEEYSLQTGGMAAAFEDPEVQRKFAAVPGGVLVSFMQWSSRGEQSVSLPWTSLDSAPDMTAFASALRATPRRFQSDTAPGSAIRFATALHQSAPRGCDRRVIDLSGDGIQNNGINTRRAATAAADQFLITINGLVILGDDDRVEPFYRHNVIAGPGAFLEIAAGYGDYPRAFKAKLLKELPQMIATRIRP